MKAILLIATILFFNCGITKGQEMNALTIKEQKIAAISASLASSNMPNLEAEIGAALDAKASISEIKSIFCQLYAYCGFPKSLNALSMLKKVVDERRTKGINDAEGAPFQFPDGSKSLLIGTNNQTKLCGAEVKGGIFDFVPEIDYYLKAHLFGDIFNSSDLEWKTRELATIAALAALPGAESQLNAHIAIGKHNGLTDEQIASILAIAKADFKQMFPKGEPNVAYAKYFTGESYLAPLTSNKDLNTPMSNVTFEPGCRNNWHSHTGGQLLIVTAGRGWYQERGKAARALKPGDVVEIPVNVEHWHGAAADSWFSHLAITCNPTTNKSTWLEPVSDEDYSKLK